jgi:hypothetical protein
LQQPTSPEVLQRASRGSSPPNASSCLFPVAQNHMDMVVLICQLSRADLTLPIRAIRATASLSPSSQVQYPTPTTNQPPLRARALANARYRAAPWWEAMDGRHGGYTPSRAGRSAAGWCKGHQPSLRLRGVNSSTSVAVSSENAQESPRARRVGTPETLGAEDARGQDRTRPGGSCRGPWAPRRAHFRAVAGCALPAADASLADASCCQSQALDWTGNCDCRG